MIALAAALALAAAPAKLDTPAFAACMAGPDAGTTLGMHTCIEAEHSRWDNRLNGAYQRLMGTLSPAGRIALRREERAWLARRDAECAHAGDDEAGGTLQGVEIDSCVLERTRRRAATLEGRR